jgi:DNA-binding SARP family transcriptional activator
LRHRFHIESLSGPKVTTFLSLLGPPSLTVSHDEGAPRPGPGPGIKGLALLAYLTLEPGPHTRDELAALLWGESPEAAARGSLRQVLLLIRQNLGDVLRVDRQTVELVAPPACEVTTFLATVRDSPGEAVAIDVPRFLGGFTLRDAPAFDDWAERKRRELVQRYQQALRGLVQASMAKSRWREARGWADRWLASDPLSDEATRLLLETLYLSGDRAGALARFREYRDRLARELESEPSAALLALAGRIEAETQAAPQPPAADPAAPRAPAFESPLVGREAQWHMLTEAWGAAAGGTGRVVLLEGGSGLGKTRVAEEFSHWALTQGVTVVRGRGYDPNAGIPYAPVAEALRGLLSAPGLAGTAPEWLAEASRLLPEVRQRFPALPEPAVPTDAAERWRLFEGLAQLVLAVAAERPTLLLIDDLHGCDGETCGLLRFLARRLEREPVMLLLTLSPGELEPEMPAARLADALRTEHRAAGVVLSPLTEEDVWHLIHEMGRIKAPAGGRRFAQRVFQLAQGNPFYTIELVKTLFAAGVFGATPLSLEWVAWAPAKLDEYRPIELPRTVRDSVAARITKLPPPLREVLDVVAVAGQGVGPELLARVREVSRVRATGTAAALVKRQLLVEEEGRFRCAHRVIQDVVREDLTPVGRLELHRALALALEALTPEEGREEVAGRIARHADQGGEPVLANRYALLACEAAARRYGFEEALAWLDLAAAAARPGAEQEEVSRRATLLLQTAGWEHPPRAVRRPGTPAWGIQREDLDLRVVE